MNTVEVLQAALASVGNFKSLLETPDGGTEEPMALRHTPPERETMKTEVLLVRIREDIEEVHMRGATGALKVLLASVLDEIKDETLAATKDGLAHIEADDPTPPPRLVSQRGET